MPQLVMFSENLPAPMPVQAVLECVDVLGLLHKVWKCIVVSDSSVGEEEPPLLMLVIPVPDGMMPLGIPGGGGPLPSNSVHLLVKPCPNTDPVLA